ncbi:hypothetical protein IJ670_08895 [bacterium]|nr:hypothetical protein [bacterium]
MNIFQKLACFFKDDSAIGLCKFNDDFQKDNSKERYKKCFKKDIPLSQMLRKDI